MAYSLRRRSSRFALAQAARTAVRQELFQPLEQRQLLSGAPTIGAFSFSTNHSTPFDLSAEEFTTESGYTDALPLASVTITTLPAHGTLKVHGSDVSTSTAIAASDLDSIVYTPDISYEGEDSFTWTASDGVATSNTANANILIADNFAPAVTSFAKDMIPSTIATSQTLDFSSTDFSTHFSDQDANDAMTSITITALPSHGLLKLGANLVTAGETITPDNISNLNYTPTAGFHAADTFSWTASDGAESSLAATVQVNVGSLAVSGATASGQVTIASGDLTPSTSDATDFGFDSTVSTRPVVVRTYTITNNTSSTITLNGAKLVSVSGGNATDFVVTQPSVSSLGAGDSTTFTITFKPSGTGLRKTTVTIASNLAGESPYTFAIQGKGVSVTTLADGVQVGTTVSGSGTGAKLNDALEVTYSGTLLDGTPISTSAFNPDFNQPFAFVVGTGAGGAAIAGWDEGLTGIKVGETRVLLIPAAEAFGDAGSGNVPPGATVIYTITATAISRPLLVVKGTGNTAIPAGDNKPSLIDGTNLGTTITSGNATLSSTFHLTGGSAGLLTFVGTPVTITGSGASNFTVTQPSVPEGGESADFTVSFNSTGTHGISTAMINIHTNDPLHPTYSFTVQASFFQVDLVPSIGVTKFPVTPITSGTGKNVTLPVVITNNGADAGPPGITTTIEVWAHPTSGSDVLVQTYTNQNVSGISPGKSKTINLTVTPPLGFPSGTYTLYAKVNTNSSVTETDTGNDTSGMSAQSLTIIEGHVDIQGNLVSTTLLPQIASGTSTTGNLVISLKNVGNVPLPSNQKVNIAIVLHGATTGDTTLKTFLNQSVGSLGATAKNYTFSNLLVPNTTVDDTYTIEAVVTPVGPLPTEDPSNNTLTTTSVGGSLTVTVSPPFTNIGGNIGTVKLTPATGVDTQPVTGTVSVIVRNTGNQKLPSAQAVQIQLFARNVTDDADNGVELNTPIGAKLYTVSNLGLNQIITANIPVTLPGGLPAGTYHIEAQVTPVASLSESSTADNHITADASGNAVVYTSAPATNNIVADHLSVSSSLTKTRAASATATGSMSVRITNAGNVPIPQGESLSIQFVAVNMDTSDVTVLQTITPSVSTWKVGQQATFSANVSTANLGLVAGTYQLEAVATFNPSLTESSTSDNTTQEVVTMTLT